MASQHVVIGIILNKNHEVLIAQRLAHQEKGGMWEFPGGKVEAGESGFQALQREFQEEIGIRVLRAELLMQVEYHYPQKTVWLEAWMIKEFDGEPCGAEGQLIEWGTGEALVEREFPEANKEIIKRVLEII